MDLIVFDKDGTVTETISGKPFPETPTDQKLRFDITGLPSNNYYAIASNQLGLSLGYKTREFLEEEFNYLEEITQYYFDVMVACPDDGQTVLVRPVKEKPFIHFDRVSMFQNNLVLELQAELMGSFRKPQPGMLKLVEAIARWTPSDPEALAYASNRSIDRRVFVGDMASDKAAAIAAGFKYWDINNWMKANSL